MIGGVWMRSFDVSAQIRGLSEFSAKINLAHRAVVSWGENAF